MPIESRSHTDAHATAPAAAVNFGARHGSSRMLETYLGDIEYLLREHFEEAVPLALALPHICAALAHEDLVSSREAYRQWCEDWVRPPQNDTSLSVPSAEELERLADLRGVERELAKGPRVPAWALRQLQLRRLSRAAPPRRRAAMPSAGDPGDDAMREACAALVDAVRRWYHDCAARDAVVQNNLARLAVLR